MLNNTKLIICNKALALVKQAPLNNLTDKTKEVEIVNLNYNLTKSFVLASYVWGNALVKDVFLQNQQPAENNLGNYKFKYLLPNNLIKIVAVNSNSYNIQNNYLFTNCNTCCLSYIYNIAEEDMPIYLVNYFCVKLALDISYSFIEDLSYINYLRALAENEFKLATNIDSKNQATNNNINSQLISRLWIVNS